jgi:hypothetical protein
MADAATLETPAAVIPSPAATPNLPVGIPDPPAKLTVPASALGLETSLDPKPSKPAEPAKPAEPTETVPASKPAAAAAPATPAAPAKPAVPAAPEKVKIGDKEYTVKELEALVAKPAAPAPAPKPAAAPAAPAAQRQPTPEEIAASKADVAQREEAWVNSFIKKEAISFPVTEDEMETILSGGKGAVELFGQKLATVSARTALLARKSMYEDLEPMIQNLQTTLTPLLTNHQDIARVAAETQFSSAFPDLKPHMSLVREIAQGLEAQFPQQVAAMSQDQFGKEVAAQVDSMLQTEYKRWFPTATDTWREKAARDVAAAAAAAPAAVVPAPAAAAAPAAPAKPRVQAPSGNSPAAIAAGSTPDFHKSVAKDLQD